MSDTQEWTTILIGIIRGQMNVEVAEASVNGDTLLGESGLGLDSIKLIELTVKLEQAFQISIPDDSLHRMGGYTISRFISEYLEKDAS